MKKSNQAPSLLEDAQSNDSAAQSESPSPAPVTGTETGATAPQAAENQAGGSETSAKPKATGRKARQAATGARKDETNVVENSGGVLVEKRIEEIVAREMARATLYGSPWIRTQTPSFTQPPGLIFSAMRNVMRGIVPLAKTHENQEGGFWFRKIDEVAAILQPLLVEHGVLTIPEVLEEKEVERPVVLANGETFVNIFTKVKVRWHLYSAVDGSCFPNPCVTMGEGMSEQHFSTAAAQTMSYKQMLWIVFCIPVFGAPDPEEASPERSQPSTPKQHFVEPQATTDQPDLFGKLDAPTETTEKKKRRSKSEQEPQSVSVGGALLPTETPAPTKLVPLTERPGFIKILKDTMVARGVTEAELFAHFEVEEWAQMNESMMNPALAFITAFITGPQEA